MKTTIKRAFIAAACAVVMTAGGAAQAQQNNSNPAFLAPVVATGIFLAAEGTTMTGYLATQSLNFNALNFGSSGWGGVVDQVHHGWKITDIDLYKYNRKLYAEVDLSKKKQIDTGNTNGGKMVVGCIMGSAAGLILASIHKGGGLRWMSQAEYEASLKTKDRSRELTPSQASWIAGTCGLAAFVYQNL